MLDPRESPGQRVMMEPMERRENVDRLVVMVRMVLLVWMGRTVLMDPRDPKETKVPEVRWVIRVRLVLMDFLVLLENGALLDPRVPKENRENLGWMDLREQLDPRVRYISTPEFLNSSVNPQAPFQTIGSN